MPNLIQRFNGEYAFLSNFHMCAVTVYSNCRNQIYTFPSAEHAYQAFKSNNHGVRMHIAELSTPGKAKRAGQELTLRANWEHLKLDVMHRVVYAKFSQHPDLMSLLLATEGVWLVEGNNWWDEYWGKCFKTNQGHNWLGHILMLVRSGLHPREYVPMSLLKTGPE